MENNKDQKQEVKVTGSFKKETPESSSVKSIEYNADTKIFTTTFKKDNAVYDYNGVTPQDAYNALHSKSHGALAFKELKAYKGVKRAEENN
jgi:hypothetical protein